MKNLFKIGFVLFTLTIILSCEKEGPAGPAGQDGNANVKTEIVKVFSYEWDYNNPLYIASKTSDLLTKDIIDNGSAHLYLEAGESIWIALPYETMGFGVAVNDLGIWTEGSVSTTTTIFKLVVIEGNLQSKSINVDFNNYNEVQEYFNLED